MTERETPRSPGDASRRPPREGPYDLIVVGGGINGVAIARDAVLRGHTVCLIEKEDIGHGTSGRSSKMLHGGLRYLESLRLGLVFESLRERGHQLRLAPHLARPQSFLIPIYETSSRKPLWVRAGVFLYDLLALGHRLGKGRMIPPAEVIRRAPGLRQQGLLGGGLYFDGIMDDARICLANILDADEVASGGQLEWRSYAEVVSVRDTSPVEVRGQDRILGTSFRVLGDRLIRAVGPWTSEQSGGQPILVPSKGVHVVLDALEHSDDGPHGLLLTHSRDRRVFFVIPWKGKTLVGTTETPFKGSPDHLRVEREEVDYLLTELRALFPGRRFAPRDIVATFAGVRPLARARFQIGALGGVSRRHRLVATGNNIYTLVGGKYTNYRAVARDVLEQVLPGEACTTHRRPLHGGDAGDWVTFRQGAGAGWATEFGESLVRRLYYRYGSRAGEVLELVRSDPALGELLAPAYQEIAAEVVHTIRHEAVAYPADFLVRRTDLRFQRGNGREVYDRVEELIREHAAPLGRVPPDLEQARASYFEALEWEDGLREEG